VVAAGRGFKNAVIAKTASGFDLSDSDQYLAEVRSMP
jgi:hypothetical protein